MQLTVLLGAPGAGKTTLLSHLRGGDLLVADMDEILEDGELLGVPVASGSGAAQWPAYNRLWVRIVSIMTRTRVPALLSAPVTPSEWETAVADVGVPVPTTFVLLDCEDGVRSRRLKERRWSTQQISEALADAAELRDFDLAVLDSTARSVAEVAADLTSMVVPDQGREQG